MEVRSCNLSGQMCVYRAIVENCKRALECSVCSCLTQLTLFDGRGVFTLPPKVQVHVLTLDLSHLQVVPQSLDNSYTRFNMGCVQCGRGRRGGHEISYVSYYVCRTCMYTIYLSYTYVLCYNIQEYRICSFCNWYIN